MDRRKRLGRGQIVWAEVQRLDGYTARVEAQARGGELVVALSTELPGSEF